MQEGAPAGAGLGWGQHPAGPCGAAYRSSTNPGASGGTGMGLPLQHPPLACRCHLSRGCSPQPQGLDMLAGCRRGIGCLQPWQQLC